MTTTKVLAWIHFANQPSDMYLATVTDGTPKNLVTLAASAELGDVAGQVVTGYDVQCADGSVLDYIEIVDASGGQTIQNMGGEREVLGTPDSNLNLSISNISIQVQRGMVIKANTAD